MLICSWKPKKKHLLLVAVILAVGILLFILCRQPNEPAKETLADGSENAERIAFLAEYGWQVSEEPVESGEVAIPLEFGDVYQNYNAIQRAQNCDLEAYRGKVVRRYSYEVLNYPAEEGPIRANLLVFEGAIIGGDICSLRLDGFMHGFELPEAT